MKSLPQYPQADQMLQSSQQHVSHPSQEVAKGQLSMGLDMWVRKTTHLYAMLLRVRGRREGSGW